MRREPAEARPDGRPGPKVRPEREGPPAVELISIGRELLHGQVEDRNSHHVARYLSQRGADVRRFVVVGDHEASIVAAVREALERNPSLLVTSGGLGPAVDDRTLGAVARALGLPLALDTHARSMVEEAYQRLRKQRVLTKGGLTASREKMCRLPVGATPVPNRLGIAPGVICRLAGGAAVLCLPGRPEEMRAVLEAAEPSLKSLAARGEVARREIEAPTADESALYPLLRQLAAEFPRVWVYSHPPRHGRPGDGIVIDLEATGATREEAAAAVDGAVKRLLAIAAGSP